MFRVHQLPTVAGTTAGRASILLKGIPNRAPDSRGYNVAGLLLSARLDLSTAAASALTAAQCCDILQLDIAHPRLRVHGNAYNLILGDGFAAGGQFASGIPSAMGASETNAIKTVNIPLFFAPPSADPSDFAIPAAALDDAEIAVTISAPVGTGTVTLNSYAITAVALLTPENDVRVPATVAIEVLTKGMDDLLPSGVYTGLVLFPSASGAAWGAAANVTQIILEGDAETVIRSVSPQAAILAYSAATRRELAGLAWTPLGSDDWIAGYASVLGIPLVFSPSDGVDSNKISTRMYSRGQAHVRLSGSATGVRYFARYYQPAGPADEAQVLSALGVSPADVVTAPKTLEGKSAPTAAIASGDSPLVVMPRKVVAAKPTAAGILGVNRIKTIL